MTEQLAEALEAEFDSVAAWTEKIVRRLGPDYAIPAACRGSANQAWLSWIADRLALKHGDRFLDAGAGLGGPAAWLSQRYPHLTGPFLAEPMSGACRAAREMFSLPTVTAWAQTLPFGNGAFDVAWCLGVLCTTSDKPALLNELRRVLTDQGRLGLLVLVQASPGLPEAPEGNHFPTETSLTAELADAGFSLTSRTEVGCLGSPDDSWKSRAARVETALTEAYGDREAWRIAQEQEDRIGRLLNAGHLETWLITALVSR